MVHANFLIVLKSCMPYVSVLLLIILSSANCSNKQEEYRTPSEYGRLQVTIPNLNINRDYVIAVGIYPYSQFKNPDVNSNLSAFSHPEITPLWVSSKTNHFTIDSLKSGFYDVEFTHSIPIYDTPLDDTSRYSGRNLSGSSKPKVIQKVRIANDSISIIEVTIPIVLDDGLISPIEELPFILEYWKKEIISMY